MILTNAFFLGCPTNQIHQMVLCPHSNTLTSLIEDIGRHVYVLTPCDVLFSNWILGETISLVHDMTALHDKHHHSLVNNYSHINVTVLYISHVT